MLREINNKKLKEILEKHKSWLNSGKGGEKADLSNTDLRYADLSNTDLRYADLRYANLRGANLSNADLSNADLSNADLRYADLRHADLSNTDLSNANLSGANLSNANLSNANLSKILVDGYTVGYFMACPEEGRFIGWKKCTNGVIVKLLIPQEAKRSSATGRKCRCDKAVVLEVIGADVGISKHDPNFIYKKGEAVTVDNFDNDRWNECSAGIHFFITRKEAEMY